MFHSPDSLPRTKKTVANFVAYNVYTSSQTITIPKYATKAFVRMCGGGGGAKATGGGSSSAAGGAAAGGYLEKFLTGLSSGLNLVFTVGAAGSSSPGNGGNSTLVSGTQIISTLTANGGGSANASSDTAQQGAGGTATGGDLNITGGDGFGASADDVTDVSKQASAHGGANPLGFGPAVSGSGATAGYNYGSGAAACDNGNTTRSASGAAGVCIIEWFV